MFDDNDVVLRDSDVFELSIRSSKRNQRQSLARACTHLTAEPLV